MKTLDGRGTVQVLPIVAAVGVNLELAAPGVGFRFVFYSIVGHGNGGTIQFRDVSTGAVQLELTGITNGRPFAVSDIRGIALFSDNEAVETNIAGVGFEGTVTFAIEPTS